MRIVEPVNIEVRKTVPQKSWYKMRRPKKRVVLFVVILFLFPASSASPVAGYMEYHTYQSDLLLAQTGMQHLRSAITLLESLQAQPFAPQNLGRVQQEFAGALSDMQAFNERVIFELRAFGVIPIIAHPERYRVLLQDSHRLYPLLEQGLLTQLTSGSLPGMQGNSTRKVQQL
jgi:hypothetical protein